jgi:hypothetical protein
MTMSKPVVKYVGDPYLADGMVYGIRPIDHPRAELNGVLVHTSRVLRFDTENGEIETLNTIYQRA